MIKKNDLFITFATNSALFTILSTVSIIAIKSKEIIKIFTRNRVSSKQNSNKIDVRNV